MAAKSQQKALKNKVHLTVIGPGRGGAEAPLTERMRELVIRHVATEMGVRGALSKPFEAWQIGVEILFNLAVTKAASQISPVN